MPQTDNPGRKLTILIAAETYPPDVNGAAQFGYRLAKGMTGRGHDVHVLATRPSKGKSYSEFRDEATVHRVRSHSVPTHESFRITFPWEIKKEIALLFDRVTPDVVTTPTPLAAKAMHDHAFLRKVLPLSNGIDAAAYELKPGEEVPVNAGPT